MHTNDKQYQTQSFINGYLTTLAWASDMDQYDYSVTGAAKCIDDCKNFITSNYDLLCQYVELIVPNEYDAWERAGHDFALTRNGHGAGFWDRDYINDQGEEVEVGQLLTEASHQAGEVYLYLNDDDEIGAD